MKISEEQRSALWHAVLAARLRLKRNERSGRGTPSGVRRLAEMNLSPVHPRYRVPHTGAGHRLHSMVQTPHAPALNLAHQTEPATPAMEAPEEGRDQPPQPAAAPGRQGGFRPAEPGRDPRFRAVERCEFGNSLAARKSRHDRSRRGDPVGRRRAAVEAQAGDLPPYRGDSAGEAGTSSTGCSLGSGRPSFAATWVARLWSMRTSWSTTAERMSGTSTFPSSKANAATMCSASIAVMLFQNIRAWL